MDKEKLKNLPESPGVYRMLDKDGKIIYIGKSKCLKQRVSTYFVPNPKWEKAKKMAPFICEVDWTVTDTHLEAMLLECELIKKIKPFFNTMMKNDSRYVYLKISEKKNGKLMKIVWEREENTFGPFRSRGRIEELLAFFPNLYPIKKEVDGNYNFQYHVFPGTLDEKEERENRQALLGIFAESAEMEGFIACLSKRMADEACRERFELAGKYRDLIENLRYINREIHLYEELNRQYILYAVRETYRYKLFLIYEGKVLHKDWLQRMTGPARKKFVKAGLAAAAKNGEPVYENEKAGRDFQDILYREISQKMEEEGTKVLREEISEGISVLTVLE